MPFDPMYSVRLEELDAQHKYFFFMLDGIEAAITAGDQARIKQLLEELLRYAQFHFASEQALMASYGYAGAAHLAEHTKLLSDVADQLKDTAVRPSALRMFLYDWLVDHIQKQDLALARFILSARDQIFRPRA